MSEDIEKTLVSYQNVIERIKKLIKLVHLLSQENNDLKQKLKKQDEEPSAITDDSKLKTLEQENLELKRENKTLKEKEKTIRTKIERLTVKLNKIEV